MRTALLLTVLVLVACSGGTGEQPTDTTVVFVDPIPRPSSSTTTTTEPVEVVDLCNAPPFLPRVVPARVVAGVPETSSIEFDEFTVIEGAWTASQFDADGEIVLVLIRGALPPRRFTGDTEAVSILDEIPAVVGPIGDGYWAAAWALPPGDRCDLYSLIFYPPVDVEEITAVVESVG